MTDTTPAPAEALSRERVRAELMAAAELEGRRSYRPTPGDFDCDCGVCSFCIRGELPFPPLARLYASTLARAEAAEAERDRLLTGLNDLEAAWRDDADDYWRADDGVKLANLCAEHYRAIDALASAEGGQP